MKKNIATSFVLFIGALAASSAMAANDPSSAMKAYSFADLTGPQAFKASPSDVTRAQIRAEIGKSGDEKQAVSFADLTGTKAFAKPAVEKSREQVKFELTAAKEAQRGRINMLFTISGFEG